MNAIAPLTLTGKYVTLEPLSPEHHDGLVDAASDGELWNLWYTSVPEPGGMRAEIERRLALQDAGSMLPFTARQNDPASGAPGKVIGMTTYMNIDAGVPRLGAKQDGVLRSQTRMPDGSLRDTVVYSILAAEWPQVRNGLDLRLAKKRTVRQQ